MEHQRFVLAFIWIAVMLIYLLGDVIRIFAGHFTPGEIDGAEFTQAMGLGIAALMVLPILMIVLSLVLPHDIARWSNIIIAAMWILFNLAGIRGYEGHYDPFLLVISMVLNGVTIWYAWTWV